MAPIPWRAWRQATVLATTPSHRGEPLRRADRGSTAAHIADGMTSFRCSRLKGFFGVSDEEFTKRCPRQELGSSSQPLREQRLIYQCGPLPGEARPGPMA